LVDFLIVLFVNSILITLFMLSGMVFGLYSNALHKKYRMPKTYILLTVIYFLLHLLFNNFGVKLPIQFFLAVLLCGCVWLGSRMCVIGLTGGIACGKSTVADILI